MGLFLQVQNSWSGSLYVTLESVSFPCIVTAKGVLSNYHNPYDKRCSLPILTLVRPASFAALRHSWASILVVVGRSVITK